MINIYEIQRKHDLERDETYLLGAMLCAQLQNLDPNPYGIGQTLGIKAGGETMTQRLIRSLKSNGLIIKEGSTANAVWRVNMEVLWTSE